MTAGTPVGSTLTRAVEQIGFFTGLGVVIVLFAAMALGRLSVISVRDARLAERAAEAAAAEEAAGEPAARAPVTTSGPVTSGSTMADEPSTTGPVIAGEPAATSRFATRRPAADGTTAETGTTAESGSTGERVAADAEPASVSADPAAERVDSTSTPR